jgi:hypothetical protein
MHLKRLFLASMLFSVLISFTLVNLVGASSEMWSKTYGSGTGHSLVETSDSGFAIAAVVFGGADFWLVKTDSYGNMEWNKTYGGTGYERAKALIETSDGGFAIAGHKQYSSSGKCDLLLVKTDANGNMEWNKTYGGAGVDYANSLIETSDGGYAMGGSFSLDYEDPFGDRDFWLVKTDSYGNMEWNKTYGKTTGEGYDYANALVEASDGGYLLAGNTGPYLVESNVWIIKTDEQGNMEWNQTYGGREYAVANSVVKTSDGGYALAGRLFGDFLLIKIDGSGNMEWNQTYSKLGGEEAYSLVETSDGGYALAGYTRKGQLNTGVTEGWLVKTDASGNEIWSQTYGGTGLFFIYSLVETSDGAFALAGYISHPYPDPAELLLIKTDKYGNIPEFPSWTIIPSVLIATVALLLFKKRLSKQKSDNYL